jgi:hypothetical protein
MAEINILEIYKKARQNSDADWDVVQEGNRIIISCNGVFRCFIGKAYEMSSRTFKLSAHMIVYNDSLSRLQFWDPRTQDEDEKLLDKIFNELHNIAMYCQYII